MKDFAVGIDSQLVSCGMTLVLPELEVSDDVVAAVSEPVAGKMGISVNLLMKLLGRKRLTETQCYCHTF